MPYVILILVLVLLVYLATKSFSGKPSGDTMAGLYLAGGVVLFVFGGLMAFSGRLMFAIPAFILGFLAVSKFMREKRLFLWRSGAFAGKGSKREKKPATSGAMSRDEAYKVLGLKSGASREEVRTAYKKFMLKMHPDAEGSEYLAQKINQARDLLLDKK